MLERHRKQLAGMSAQQIRDLATELERQVSGRGFLVRFAAAGEIREMRQMAARMAKGDADVSR